MPALEDKLGSKKDALLAPIIRRYKNKLSLSKLADEMQVVLPYAVSSHDKKLLYIKNSKVACTSISKFLYEYSNGHAFEGNIHKDGIDLHHGLHHWQGNLALLRSSTTVVFSFVRHPERRCVSAFQNFFVDRSNSVAQKHIKAIEKFGFNLASPPEENFDIFLNYIDASHKKSALYTDRHWRAQHINLGIGQINYDHIGKLENLDSEMRAVLGLAKLDEGLFAAMQNQRSNASSPSPFEVSTAQSARIKALYAADFEMFDYA